MTIPLKGLTLRVGHLVRPTVSGRALLAAFGAGMMVAAGQAPWGFWMLSLAGLTGLFWLVLRGRAPGWSGFAAGAGYGALALNWIVSPFFVDAARDGWMAPFALILMAAGMGTFWGIGLRFGVAIACPTGTVRRARPGLRRFEGYPPLRACFIALGMATGMGASDLLRGYVLTGFPWALLGHVWLGTPLMQVGALIGPVGLSMLLALPAAGIALLLSRPSFSVRYRNGQGQRTPVLLAVLAMCCFAVMPAGWVWGLERLAQPLIPRDPALTLRLVQPNAPQHLKWRRDMMGYFFTRALDLTEAPSRGAMPDLVIWPETTAPFWLDQPGFGLEEIAEAARIAATRNLPGGSFQSAGSGAARGAATGPHAPPPVALGIQRADGTRYFNSMAIINPDATVGPVYDKFHLVPFGEYLPLGDLLAKVGISAFAAQAGHGYTAGTGAQVLDLGRLGKVQPLICYEAVFPQDLRAAPERPDWVMQITNDAWFGSNSGPQQHLAQARLRAVEMGLPVARAANTGITAMIDPYGRITGALALDTRGVLDVSLPAALPETPYARWGDLPIFIILTVFTALLLVFRRYGVDPAGRAV
jgi:apolipoprotein N-acyltransferase